MTSGESVALLILSYDSKSFLRDCITSLLGQTYQDFQIFLIDNHSIDGSVELVRHEFPQVNIIANPENYGFGRGFNEGIRLVQSKFDYMGLLNPDIKADPRWLEESVNTLREFPQAQICNSLVLNWDGNVVENAGGAILNLAAGVFGGFLSGTPRTEIPQQYKKRAFPVFFGIANAIVIKAQAFAKYGLLDENYFMYFEDIDLSWRILTGGGQVYCNPQAVVFHYGHGAKKSKEISLLLRERTETNLLSTYFKNLSLPTLILMLPLVVIVRSLVSLPYVLISPRLTWRKLKGIASFFLSVPSLYPQRQAVQRNRMLGDWAVFASNPGSLFSFREVAKLAFPWFRVMAKIHRD